MESCRDEAEISGVKKQQHRQPSAKIQSFQKPWPKVSQKQQAGNGRPPHGSPGNLAPSIEQKPSKSLGNSKKEKQENLKKGSSNPVFGDRKGQHGGHLKSAIVSRDVSTKSTSASVSVKNPAEKQKKRCEDRRFANCRRKHQSDVSIGKKSAKLVSIEEINFSNENQIVCDTNSVNLNSSDNTHIVQNDKVGCENSVSVRPKVNSDSSDGIHLKSVLKVLRSNLSPAEKLHAIKCNKDHWDQLSGADARVSTSANSQMESANQKVDANDDEICKIINMPVSNMHGKTSFGMENPNQLVRQHCFASNSVELTELPAIEGGFSQMIIAPELETSKRHFSALTAVKKDGSCDEGISVLSESEESSVIKMNLLESETLFHPIACAQLTERESPIDARAEQDNQHSNCDPLICDELLELSMHSILSCESQSVCKAAFDHEPKESATNCWTTVKQTVTLSDSEKPVSIISAQDTSNIARKARNTLTPIGLSVDIKGGSLQGNRSTRAAPKSPVTVQEWVDSIDVVDNRTDDGADTTAKEIIVSPANEEDNLGLGAEAYNLNKKKESLNVQARPPLRKGKGVFAKARDKNNSFHSEVSATSTCSLSSVEALLETMQHDPEDILLSLGFGNTVADPLSRIPHRFLKPSRVQGNNLKEFLEKQEEMLEIYDMGFSGYRGLSGFRMDGHTPSGIVCKILEKIRERNRELKRNLSPPSLSVSSPSMSFYHAAFSLMAVNAFRNSIRKTNSILEPKNREFLDSQDEGSARARGKRRPRLILGRDSLALDSDEEFIDEGSYERLQTPVVSRKLINSEGSNETVKDTDVKENSPTILNDRTLSSPSSVASERHRTLSDEFFLCAEKKPTFWSVLRDKRISPVPTNPSSIPLEGASTDTQVPLKPVRSAKESASSLSDDTNVSVANSELSESSKRLSRLTRQLSVDEELSSDSDPVSQTQHHPKLGSIKMEIAANKDSFELEELPANCDEDMLLPNGQLQVNIGDAPRTGSAMSDSSGFLDGELMEANAVDVSDELLPEFTSHARMNTIVQSSSHCLKSRESSIEVLQSVAEGAFFIGAPFDNDDVETKTESGRRSPMINQSESGFESFGTQEKDECEVSQATGGLSPVGYLSESETLVVDFASSSSGEALSSQNDKSPISSSCDLQNSVTIVLNEDNDGLKSSKSTTSVEWSEIGLQLRTLNSNGKLHKSASEVDLNRLRVFRSPHQQLNPTSVKSGTNSLENINFACDSNAFPRFQIDVCKGNKTTTSFEESHSSESCLKIGEFHESCLLTIQRMQDVMRLYQKKLRQMERTCWDTYHHCFPGVTKAEREELENLCDLRKLILEEVSKTQLLLSNRDKAIRAARPSSGHSSCDIRLVTVAEELGELLKEQNVFYNQLEELSYDSIPVASESCHQGKPPGKAKPTQVEELPELLKNVKQEVMTEVKGMLHEDHERFHSELTNTRQGIEDVKSVLTALLSAIQLEKS